MRTEISAIWQRLREVEPNKPHVYGDVSTFLVQQQGQQTHPSTNGIQLPTLQPPAHWQPNPPSQAPAGAMQGVEFQSSRPLEQR